MHDLKSRQGIYSHYNKLNKRVISTLPLVIWVSLEYCDLITIYNLALVKDSNLIRITNKNGSPKLFRIPYTLMDQKISYMELYP